MLDLNLGSKHKGYLLDEKRERIVQLDIQNNTFDIIAWAKEHKSVIEEIIQNYGGILLRNTNLYSVSEFNQFVSSLYPNLLEYIYRSTPRTKLGGKIYTATEYAADRPIPLHNEFSYANIWPSRIIFFSIIPAKEGGETPVADCSRVFKSIDKAIIDTFEKKEVLYVRNYREGLDLSWQEVFQTTDKMDVGIYCKENGIEYEWKSGLVELTTRKKCQAIIQHPVTGDKIWFNQAHLFHVSSLDDKIRQVFLDELGEDKLPRNSFYGDGSQIDLYALENIRLAYEQEKIKFKWQQSDILILDNMLMAHGREPYLGDRKIAVAMAV